MRWWALGRVDELARYADSTWRAMRDSGLRMVYCGVESGSDETLHRMNKGGTVSADLAVELAARMKAYGVVPEYSFVLGSPPDADADLDRSLALIRRVKRVNPATEIILYTYAPVVNSTDRGELGRSAQQAGFAFPTRLDDWVRPPWRDYALRRTPATPWSDAKLYRRIRDFERVINARYPTVTDVRLTPLRRSLLRAASAWRYRLGVYAHPIELRALLKLCTYRRAETIGF
jgi:radical SAM superfamily enzyme YgiQ (UPF0313 family)